MTTKNRKLKIITFTLVSTQFQCQIQSWKLNNNTADGERFYTYCAADSTAEFREDAEDDYSLDLKFFSDWTVGGISDFLVANNKAVVAFQLDHHPDIPGEYVRWSGSLKVKAPPAGGDARTTEIQELTMPIVGIPLFTRP